VTLRSRWLFALLWLVCLGPFGAFGQIDPVKRDLLQFGYNAAFEGHPPLSLYAYYYRNQPNFIQTNLTLRMAIAPTYIDSELGISHVGTEYTDLGIDLAGGGFADSYQEIQRGTFIQAQSFIGHSVEGGLSIYHLFNPGQLIPLYALARGEAHYSMYERDDDTASNFKLPHDHTTFNVRTGLRWGGREPTLLPDLAMELSIWYQGEFRTDSGTYGFNDRELKSQSHLFWAEAALAYTMPTLKHSFFISLTAGTSVEADRLSAYRLGALLPLAAEFPLSLPGYYNQELSAERFVLLASDYILPLDKNQRWNIAATASTAFVDYLDGLEQPGHWNTGLGGGLLYRTDSLKILMCYAYGVDAMRSHGRGADSIGVLLQIDLAKAHANMFNPVQPNMWQGLQRVLGVFGD
jgi:hypothetical protein